MTNNNLFQDGDKVLGNIIIDYINNFNFDIKYYFKNKDTWESLGEYVNTVFSYQFEEDFAIKYKFFSKCISLFDIFIDFFSVKIQDDKLCFSLSVSSEHPRLLEYCEDTHKDFEIDIKKEMDEVRELNLI